MTFDPNRPPDPAPLSPGGGEPTPAPYLPSPAATPPVIEPSPLPTAPVAAPAPAGAALASPRASRKARSGGVLNVVLVIAASVAIGGVAFAAGRTTAPVAATTGRGAFGGGPGASFVPGANGGPGRGGFGGALGGGGFTVRGTVESVNGNTLTIKTASGQMIEITTGATTTYNTQAPASASDVQAGKTVEVQLAPGSGRPSASASPSGALGTAGSVTVIP